jgi:hypothetical protein
MRVRKTSAAIGGADRSTDQSRWKVSFSLQVCKEQATGGAIHEPRAEPACVEAGDCAAAKPAARAFAVELAEIALSMCRGLN